jgi:hypothetical protein
MWLTALFAAASPLVNRVLIGLGFGIITYASTTILINSVIANMQQHFNSMPSNVFMIISLFGVPDSLGIILGAFVTSSTLQVTKRLGLI